MGELTDALASQDGWQGEGYAARVHYRGAADQYSVEFYDPNECVLYWKVHTDGESAVPIARDTVPEPLRERIRADLSQAGIDPRVERKGL